MENPEVLPQGQNNEKQPPRVNIKYNIDTRNLVVSGGFVSKASKAMKCGDID
jgi:hypothetical protein